jgi:predicted CopG family antitoxin
LAIKREEESFSELFERLVEEADSLEILRKIRGSVEFAPGEKEELLAEFKTRRSERRP